MSTHWYTGSGVVIGPNLVLTVFHNVEFPQGSKRVAKGVALVASRPEVDICVIRYPTGNKRRCYLSPDTPKPGTKVTLYGHYGTYYGTVYTDPERPDRLAMRFTKPPRMGDSGGGVHDGKGLVGIFTGHNGRFYLAVPRRTLIDFGIKGQTARYQPQTGNPRLPGTTNGPTYTQSPPQRQEEEPKGQEQGQKGLVPYPKDPPTFPDPPKVAKDPPTKQELALTPAGVTNLQGASLPPSTESTGGGFFKPFAGLFAGKLIKTYVIPSVLGALGIAATGGTGYAAYFGGKAVLALWRRRKKRKADTNISDDPPGNTLPGDLMVRTLKEELEEVLGRSTAASGFPGTRIPGRKVDEIGEILQLAELDGYDPLMGSTYGLFMQDEITKLLSQEAVSDQDKTLIRQLVASVTDRINSAAPLVKG